MFGIVLDNTKTIQDNDVGRPKKTIDDKKKPVCLKLSPWILDALDSFDGSRAEKIETAVIDYFKLKKPEKL